MESSALPVADSRRPTSRSAVRDHVHRPSGRRWQRIAFLILILVFVWFALQLYALVLYLLLTGDGL